VGEQWALPAALENSVGHGRAHTDPSGQYQFSGHMSGFDMRVLGQ
jgi:protocatechuate 3,4-dioxygenase beta subunit